MCLVVAPTVFPFSRHRADEPHSLPPPTHHRPEHDTESSWRRCATLRCEPFVNLVMQRAQSIHDPFPPAQMCLLSNWRCTIKYNNRLYTLHRRSLIYYIYYFRIPRRYCKPITHYQQSSNTRGPTLNFHKWLLKHSSSIVIQFGFTRKFQRTSFTRRSMYIN